MTTQHFIVIQYSMSWDRFGVYLITLISILLKKIQNFIQRYVSVEIIRNY
jgi:hypothetical protein